MRDRWILLIIPFALFGAQQREFTDAQEQEFSALSKKWSSAKQNKVHQQKFTEEEKIKIQNDYVRMRIKEADLKLYSGTFEETLVLNIDYRNYLSITAEDISAYVKEQSIAKGSVCVSYKFPITTDEIMSIFDALKDTGFEQILIYQNNSSWQTVVIDWRLHRIASLTVPSSNE